MRDLVPKEEFDAATMLETGGFKASEKPANDVGKVGVNAAAQNFASHTTSCLPSCEETCPFSQEPQSFSSSWLDALAMTVPVAYCSGAVVSFFTLVLAGTLSFVCDAITHLLMMAPSRLGQNAGQDLTMFSSGTVPSPLCSS